MLEHDLVDGVEVGADGCTDDVGGDTRTRIELAVGAELHESRTHSLFTLGHGLDLEVVQLEVTAHDLLQCHEGGVDGAVAHGNTLQGLSMGDGPIDAAFVALEQIMGCHFELDDFQIQAVTEGKEAMGSALVKLRAEGKLYAGTGISTDIIGASIRAYLNAVNKIVFEQTV